MPRHETSRRRSPREGEKYEEYTERRGSFMSSGRGRNYRRDGSRKNDERPRRAKRDHEKTKVTCSACGETCEVPFKPTSNKPIYCDKCFKKDDSRSSRSNGPSGKDIEAINEKLDKILEAMGINK